MNLRPALEETAPVWRELLEQMYKRGSFILGEQVTAFERDFASSMGARFAVGVGTGSAAIELCLRAARVIRAEQQVITSPLTAPFTGIAILAAGASARFADIDPETLLLDPDDAGNRARKQTAAIIPVHLYGQPCDIRRFRRLGLPLIQDACQAHGALAEDFPYVAYSFYPTKNLGCLGDGGAVTTNSLRIANRIRLLRDGGRKENHVSIAAGINSRLDEAQACYLSAFLPRLKRWSARRREIAELYDQGLQDCGGVRPVKRTPASVCHLYVVRVRRRAALCKFLAGRGIGTGVHYPVPLHLQPAFRDAGLRRGDLPQAERAAREIVSLPLWPDLSTSQVGCVVDAVREFYRS